AVSTITALSLALPCWAEDLGLAPEGKTGTWAVIAAGSKGYMNYRHQADACHAYQVLRRTGVPADHIILMMQDDVADWPRNPFRGKLFNKPGEDAVDVYDGCKVDYRGDVVTAKLFQAVITGDKSGVPRGGRVLESGPQDRVFLNFVDHGGVGIVAFPNGIPLHAADLSKSLEVMQSKSMFSELLFYMEACESGSMFPDLSDDDKIFALTAANSRESSWGEYCMPDNDTVNGKHLNTCLGDTFSIAWMEDSDLGKLGSETIREQVKRVKKRTDKSHVSQFGDSSFEDEPAGGFLLQDTQPGSSAPLPAGHEGNRFSVRDIGLQTAWHGWNSARHEEKAEAWQELQQVVAARAADEALFDAVVRAACGSKAGPRCIPEMKEAQLDMKDVHCHRELAMAVYESCPPRSAHDSGGWNGFNMQFSQTLANLCETQQTLAKTQEDLLRIVHSECRIASQAAEAAIARTALPEVVV
ncbi:unnamed protein product, partial [Polarella glacialis]